MTLRFLKPITQPSANGRVFFYDNLDAHKSERFKEAMKPSIGNDECVLFPPNMTDVLHPGLNIPSTSAHHHAYIVWISILHNVNVYVCIVFDAGFGRFLKYHMSLALDECLESQDFLQKWMECSKHGNAGCGSRSGSARRGRLLSIDAATAAWTVDNSQRRTCCSAFNERHRRETSNCRWPHCRLGA